MVGRDICCPHVHVYGTANSISRNAELSSTMTEDVFSMHRQRNPRDINTKVDPWGSQIMRPKIQRPCDRSAMVVLYGVFPPPRSEDTQKGGGRQTMGVSDNLLKIRY